MKITDAQLALVLRPGVVKLAAMFEKYNHEMRIAGGAVRDLLRGIDPHDLDFATTATPDQMKEMFEKEEVRMIGSTGEKHGTITARIDEENFECTTLRIDITTDGRHAEVQFTKDWYLDANRRDLTINSMFLGLDGTVYDYFNGKEHLERHQVEFVGDADKRIQEDYLRILRYFRFYGRIAKEPIADSPGVLEAITRNGEGLSKISGERIWMELQRIVVGNFGGHLLRKIMDCKLGPAIGLPSNFNSEHCIELLEKCESNHIDKSALQAMTVLAVGFSNTDDAYEFIARIKCSRKERELLVFIIEQRKHYLDSPSLKSMQDMLTEMVVIDKRRRDVAMAEISQLLLSTYQKEMLDALIAWEIPKFPVTGGMLVGKVKHKKMIRAVTLQLFKAWRDSDYSLTNDELLEAIDEQYAIQTS